MIRYPMRYSSSEDGTTNTCVRQRDQHHGREDRWGITDHRDPRLPKTSGPKGPMEGVWRRSNPVGSGVPAAADPDEEVADPADDEYDEPMVQATRSAQGESSATASVGAVSTIPVQEEPLQ